MRAVIQPPFQRSGLNSNQPSARLKGIVKFFYAIPVLCVLAIVGFMAWAKLEGRKPAVHVMPAAPFLSQPIDGLLANFFAQGNRFSPMGTDLFIEFRNSFGKLADVGSVKLELTLNTTNMIMHAIGIVLPTATPGQYRTTVQPQLAGPWKAELSFSGPAGSALTNFVVMVK